MPNPSNNSAQSDEVVYPWDISFSEYIKRGDGSAACVGTSKGDRGLLLVSKSALPMDPHTRVVSTSSREMFRNSKYSKFTVEVADTWCVELICPATDRDIAKHATQQFFMFRETAEVHATVTRPFIDSIGEDAVQWVFNILDGTSEAENVVARSSAFIVVKDYKWRDEKDLSLMHLLAIVRDRSLKSLRDLTGDHVSLLRDIRDEGLRVLHERFSVDRSEVRVYLHYLPTFYHLHVHFDHVSGERLGGSWDVGKAILLDDVIDNLARTSDHYTTGSMTVTLGTTRDAKLIEMLQAAGELVVPSTSS
eukprot:m.156685 g.156685  ORF g.156685 m.156685 type:complete len:306 (+) comp17948_c0_seq2:230-1147(+)